MVKMIKTKHRVVRDSYLGYEVQFRWWWCPFWFQVGINTFLTLEKAIQYAEYLHQPVLWESK